MGGQLQNLLLLTSPLGDDTQPTQEGTLHAVSLDAVEKLSEPFVLNIGAVSTEQQLAPSRLLHKPITLTVHRKDGTDRYFNGLVRHVSGNGIEQRGRWEYHLEVVPSLWFLSQTSDSRIFQNKTSVEILQIIFSTHGVQPVEFRVSGSQPVREYTTQFNESDLDFCHRIMQESGFFYYFIHTKNQHILVVTNSNQGFTTMEEPSHRVVAAGNNVDIISDWHTGQRVAPSKVVHRDYDPTRPSTPVVGHAVAEDPSGNSHYSVWPALTSDHSHAQDRSRHALEAGAAESGLGRGKGYNPHFSPGYRFSIDNNPSSAGSEYIVQATHHHAVDQTWLGGTSPAQYGVNFKSFEANQPWREHRTLPRPSMPGIYSAIVLGEGGEEIHVDRLGRIKVRLLFDHRRDTVGTHATWVRVLQPWAGNGWGWQHLPRVGSEVGVSFISGDCDNPVVVGSFYHEQNKPAFSLPGEKTKTGFRSRSTMGGGTADYNELSFDDQSGQEKLFMQAQRDHHVKVKRNELNEVGLDRTTVVERNETFNSRKGDIHIQADSKTITIQAAQEIRLECGNSSITIGPDSVKISSPKVITEGQDVQVEGDSEVLVKGGMIRLNP
ncbi:type VI secretion system Vgr family protein [Swingsia samuiensis]|uniref:Type VI secretion system tip protein VgrG n=1 Tax=Swingsia samuiensis TaxID=1293412 RepID=A0A4Y6UFJ3_9PROT|nr:type VI secretion system tip protein TssI/VgrG [Swingsia samuiensis]QDH16322.1 type VI secretion system tip protein VgrG [Swingsia samuiensis]